MKKTYLLITTACFLLLFVFLPPSNKAWLYKWEHFLGEGLENHTSSNYPAKTLDKERSEENESFMGDVINIPSSKSTKQKEPSSFVSITPMEREGAKYIRLSEIKQQLPITVKLDQDDGKVYVYYQNHTLEMVHSIPVLNKNGIFEPLEAAPIIENDDVFVPISLLQNVLGQSLILRDGMVEWKVDSAAIPAFASKPELASYSPQEIADYLSFLQNPIPGARVSVRDSHLPGAPRTYRGGVHEGIDWYSYGSGMKIDKNTPVYSMADGVVVRADFDYQEMTPEEREKLLEQGRKNKGQTPEPILDKLRGRSVWVQYDKGVMARYVHLDRIASNVKVGEKIRAGELIGYVGNSGTSDGAKGTNQGLHLHLDILLYGEWFWGNYTMQERRMILEQVFNQ